jgi:hypothetical protein
MRIGLIFFILSLGLPAHADPQKNLLIRSATIIDGTDSAPQPNMDLEVISGRITRIGHGLVSQVKPVIDGHGLFVMPGLIDCHTHLHSVPGSVFRADSPQDLHTQQLFQLKAYLAAGVTTVLDAAAPESLLREIQNLGDTRNEVPRVLALAPFLTPEGGYFASAESRGELYKDLWPPVHDSTTIAQNIAAASQFNPLGVKVTFESGFGPFEIWPLFDDGLRDTITTESAKYHLPIFAHSMTEKEHRLALTLKPFALLHAGFGIKPASDEMIHEIKESGAYVVTTLAIYKMTLLMWDHEALDDPWLRMLVPENQILTARNPDIRAKVIQTVVSDSAPKWMPKFISSLFATWFFNPSSVRTQMSNSMTSVARMQEAGIPLVMGSDAGNWPVWTTFFHGAGTILEMEALEEAGLPRLEIVKAATSRAAKMLKIDRDVGTIAVGKAADLLILGQNPLDSIKTLRNLKWVIRNGIARTPAEWLDKPTD